MKVHDQAPTTKTNRKMNPIRMIASIAAICFIVFGAILLADGLADASNRAPTSEKRYQDNKELAISCAFLLGGVLVIGLSSSMLRPRHSRNSVFLQTSVALGCGLLLSLILRGVDLRFNKPHWFTTNVPCKIPMGGDSYRDSEIRSRALIESMNAMFAPEQ